MATRMFVSELIKSGSCLCEVLLEEPNLKEERAVVLAKNTDLDEIEKSLKESIALMFKKIEITAEDLKKTQAHEKSLETYLEKRKMELERDEERLATFMNVRPAYMDEYEVLQKELQGLFTVYDERFRNLQWLEAQLDGFRVAEQQKHEEVQHRMRSLQRRFHEEEVKILHGVDMVSFPVENDQTSEIGDLEGQTEDFSKYFPISQTWCNPQPLESMKLDKAMHSISSGTPSLEHDGEDNDTDSIF